MPICTPTRKRQRGATIVLLLTMMPLVLIPLIGLAIDGTRLYIVQSKLSAAVDGAALGSGRLLGTSANTTEIAGEFLNVNFPSGYWSTGTMTKNITFTTNLGTQTISVNASVVLPLTFARVMGQSSSLISATAVATRRVTRVEMVLDRSGSMQHTDPVTGADVFTTMKASAQWFAAQFTPNYDEVGLVMFNGSGLVAYPTTRPWDPSTSGVGGPDKSFSTDPQNQVGPIFTQLSNMAVGGGTGTPEALALAYIELQKAHNRDLAANGVDNTLNTLVLFTDGVPDAIPAYINNPANNSLKPSGSGSNQSKCPYNPATAAASTQMRGYLVAPGGPPGNGVAFPGWNSPNDNTYALIQLANYDTAHNLTWWEGTNGAKDLSAGAPTTALNGCTYLSTGDGGNSTSGATDLAKIPDTDLYGYSTTGSAYLNSSMTDGTNTWQPNTGSYDPLKPTKGYHVAAASWNETDNIGKAIRNQTAMNQIQIFTIGYSGTGGTDVGLLKRLANTPDSTSFISSQPIGKFYQVNSTNQLVNAFDAVASSLLRLAQ